MKRRSFLRGLFASALIATQISILPTKEWKLKDIKTEPSNNQVLTIEDLKRARDLLNGQTAGPQKIYISDPTYKELMELYAIRR